MLAYSICDAILYYIVSYHTVAIRQAPQSRGLDRRSHDPVLRGDPTSSIVIDIAIDVVIMINMLNIVITSSIVIAIIIVNVMLIIIVMFIIWPKGIMILHRGDPASANGLGGTRTRSDGPLTAFLGTVFSRFPRALVVFHDFRRLV